MSGRRHHVVSQGYLRNWTESRQLRLIWKNEARSPRTVLTGTRDAFVRSGFNSYVGDEGVDDSLEREWARLEGGALPVLRSIANGTVDPQDPSVVVPVKSMSAVHWVRSYALRDLTVNNYLAHEQEAIRDWPELPDLVAAFKADHDREPLPGEIADHVARGFAQRRRSNYFLIDHMVSLYNKSMAEFERFNLEVATVPVPTHDLLTSDSPNVITDGIRVGVGSGLALMESNLIYMPVGPCVAVSLITQPPRTIELPPYSVQFLNWLMCRNVQHQLAARPSVDWARALVKRPVFGGGWVPPQAAASGSGTWLRTRRA